MATRTEVNTPAAHAGIVPHNHSKLKGVDIAGFSREGYSDTLRLLIFRPDLGDGLYLEADPLGATPRIKPMLPEMKEADHYCCTNSIDGKYYVYMIKAESAARMNLYNPTEFRQFPLHPNCRGGDHYIAFTGHFIIIFQSRGVYRVVEDLESDKEGKEYTLHEKYRNKLYYWGFVGSGARKCFMFLDQVDEWKKVKMTTKFNDLEDTDIYTQESYFPAHLVRFLPGGISPSVGPCIGEWSLVQSIENPSDSQMIWEQKVTTTVGHNKSVAKTIGENWEVSASASTSVKAWVMEASISLSATYGGTHSDTHQEDWSESHTVEKSVQVTVEPHKAVYLWQYLCNMGEKPALFCKNLKLTKTKERPTDMPLPESDKP